MKIIGLPGRNPETEAWMESLVGSLELGQSGTSVAHYRHWDSGGDPDVLHEAGQVQLAGDDVAVGKSMGTMVLLASATRSDQPAQAVFIGTPISGYPAESIELLQKFADSVPSLFIQQTDDFTGNFGAVNEVVGDMRCASLAEVAGQDHVYADTAELKVIIEEWWQSLG